jgi:diaminohydroxyphosphoribosylaminopyrimidine deaminase/5-amino-6-(5-phosphoribosylamino)uracil reductase
MSDDQHPPTTPAGPEGPALSERAPGRVDDVAMMRRAITVAGTARLRSAPNPWVGAVVVCADGRTFEGATEPPGRRHAERVALDAAASAGADTTGSTVYTTLEPCSHHGRTPPCVDALVAARVARVVAAIDDPDPKVAGRGHDRLAEAGIGLTVGVCGDEVAEQLAPYLHHRRTGRPYVVLKLAATLDGRTAAADGTSRWITGPQARAEVHRLRAESGAVVVGAGTVRADDPALTVRHVEGPDPRRVVLGTAPAGAKVHPCLEWRGPLPDLLDRLGSEGVLQVLVEGGAKVASSFHRDGLVDRYVLHLAPALMGGDDGTAVFAGLGTATISELWRGRVLALRRLGPDIEIQLVPQEDP